MQLNRRQQRTEAEKRGDTNGLKRSPLSLNNDFGKKA